MITSEKPTQVCSVFLPVLFYVLFHWLPKFICGPPVAYSFMRCPESFGAYTNLTSSDADVCSRRCSGQVSLMTKHMSIAWGNPCNGAKLCILYPSSINDQIFPHTPSCKLYLHGFLLLWHVELDMTQLFNYLITWIPFAPDQVLYCTHFTAKQRQSGTKKLSITVDCLLWL